MKSSDAGRRSANVVLAAVLAGGLLGVVPSGTAHAADCAEGALTAAQLPDDAPWAQRVLKPEKVWPMTTGAGQIVAVIDSGVQADHEVLEGKVLPGKAYIDASENEKPSSGDDAREDCLGHGTAVAGLIAGKNTGNSPFQGVAPDAQILPIRVANTDPGTDRDAEEDEDNPVTPGEVAAAVDYAVAQDADVINMSLKYSEDHPVLRSAIASALAADVVVVAAGGNNELDGAGKPSYPAAYDGVIGVGAVNQNGIRLPQSQVGRWIDLVAPGEGLTAPQRDGNYRVDFGHTSGATAFVSGTAALLRSYRPDWTQAEVSDQLIGTASMTAGPEVSPEYGHGMVSPYSAITENMAHGKEPVIEESMDRMPMDDDFVQRMSDFEQMTTTSLWIGLGGFTAFIATLFGVAALRRGKRSKWHTKRVTREEQLEPMDDGDPIQLYHGIRGIKR